MGFVNKREKTYKPKKANEVKLKTYLKKVKNGKRNI